MIPVDQTYFVGDDSGVKGNCLQAAVASLLEKPLDAVPHFVEFGDWRAALYLYLEGESLEMRVHKEDPGIECIATGMSPRQVYHAIVWNKGLAHDPHPSRGGFVDDPTEFWVITPEPEEEIVVRSGEGR